MVVLRLCFCLTSANHKYNGTYRLGSEQHPAELTSWTGPYLNATLIITVTDNGDCFLVTEKMYATDNTGTSKYSSLSFLVLLLFLCFCFCVSLVH